MLAVGQRDQLRLVPRLNVSMTSTPDPSPGAHPVVHVLTAPEVLTALGSLTVAAISILAVLLRLYGRRIESTLTHVGTKVTQAADAAEGARDQVSNNHQVNLRDDLDSRFASVISSINILGHRIERLSGQVGRLEERQERAEIAGEARDMRIEMMLAPEGDDTE